MKENIRTLTKDELKEIIVEYGEKPFRANQLYDWLHVKLARSLDDMSNVSKSLKAHLSEDYTCDGLKIVDVQTSAIDGTKKFLFGLEDGNVIESVWMKYKSWDSVCISSQVGCKMGCKFCASTLDGCVRSLTAGEMLDEVYTIQKYTGERVSNIVVMGSGEPMDNYDNLVKFVRMISNEDGLHISQRNITVSTCGLVPQMYKLADEKLEITLALSLHAPNDEKRKALMPIANRYSLKEVIAACRNYFDKTGRRLTFEYALVAGNNDSDRDAAELAELIKGINAHVNLIPVNPIKERNFKRSTADAVNRFKNKLEKMRINVTIRREMGSDIDGACGQLRRKHMEESSGC